MERILWNQKLKIMIAMSHNVKDFQRRILKKSMLTMDAKIQVKSKVMSRLEVIQFKITAVVTRKPVKSSDPCNPDPCGPLSKCTAIIKDRRSPENMASCTCQPGAAGKPPHCRPQMDCRRHSDCPSNLACQDQTCNGCLNSLNLQVGR